jgi:hypothetical protein
MRSKAGVTGMRNPKKDVGAMLDRSASKLKLPAKPKVTIPVAGIATSIHFRANEISKSPPASPIIGDENNRAVRGVSAPGASNQSGEAELPKTKNATPIAKYSRATTRSAYRPASLNLSRP